MSRQNSIVSAEEAKQGAAGRAQLGVRRSRGVDGVRAVGVGNDVTGGGNAPSRMPGRSPFTRSGKQRDSLDEETTDWRAVCGKTARTVRREGRPKAFPTARECQISGVRGLCEGRMAVVS